MTIRQFVVDAFTSEPFKGNPAAVCPLAQWLDDHLMQSIAAENNISETAFFMPMDEGIALRWFTPVTEVDLCGHATLAAAHVLFNHLGFSQEYIRFQTRSGELRVRKAGDMLEMTFPGSLPVPCAAPDLLVKGLGAAPMEVFGAEDYLVLYPNEAAILALKPDFQALAKLDKRGVCATAPSDKFDFVSRFFAPSHGINEDPVTGSAHCQLAPFWASRTEKTRFHAKQLSQRGGEVLCEVQGDKVLLAGHAVTFLQGEIHARFK